MSLQWAVIALLALAVIVLFCALAAVFREVLALRHQVSRMGTQPAGLLGVVTPVGRVLPGVDTAWVLVADGSCELCHEVVAALDASGHNAEITLLSRQPYPAPWNGRRRVEPAAFDVLEPLTPPTVLRVDTGGTVLAAHLPTSGPQAVALFDSTSFAQTG